MKKGQRSLFDDLPSIGESAYPSQRPPVQDDPFQSFVTKGMAAQSATDKITKKKATKPKKQRLPSIPLEPRYAKGLLALDIATTTGFCTSTASGVWNLTPKKDESKGMRLIRFRSKVKELCQLEGINMVVFEQIAVYGKYPNTVGIEMIGVLKLFCEENNIDYKAYPVKSIKMQTGNGNAGKDEMVMFARHYKADVASDDEADAIILYQLAVYDLNL